MSNTNIAGIYQKTSALLQTWGSIGLPNGKTFSETITIQGIPLWDMICPQLAVYALPKVFLSKKKQASILSIIRPYLGRAKQIALECFIAKRGTNGCFAWPLDPVILILGFNSYMEQTLEPIARRLSESRSSQNIILVDWWRDQTKASSTYGSGIQSIWQHWNRETKLLCQTMLGELKKVNAELKVMGALKYILKEGEQPLMPEMQTLFTWLFKQRLPQLMPHAAVASHILEHHKPVLIISGDCADPRTRVYYFFGKRYAIPSLEIQYGQVTPNSVEYRFALADRVAVFGEQSRRIMKAHGVPLERIIVTGSPRHDSLVNSEIPEVASVRSQLGIPVERKMILFAATYFIDGHPGVKKLGLQIMADLFTAASRNAELTLVVKPHPILNQPDEIKQIAGKGSNIVFADPSANIQPLIRACDAFIALGSTTTLDAMIANKLTITPAYPGWLGNKQYVESRATMVPSSAMEIAQCLEIAASPLRVKTLADLEPARSRFLHEWIFKADGQATDRILEIIREMLQTENGR